MQAITRPLSRHAAKLALFLPFLLLAGCAATADNASGQAAYPHQGPSGVSVYGTVDVGVGRVRSAP